MPQININEIIQNLHDRKNIAAATAASECGTAKLEHMMTCSNGQLYPAEIITDMAV